MPDYKEMYYALFNKVTDVIEELKDMQIKLEEMYVNSNNEADN